ncbi:MAG: discoidin domain-containing protein [Protaetiibacter sp.]
MRHVTTFLASALALALSVTGAVSTASAATPDDDVRTMVSRIEQYYLDQGDDIIIANGIYLARTSEALDYVASQRPDGSWADVDYADRTSSANGKTWSAYIALYRMLALTQAYRDPSAAGYGSPAVLTAVERSLAYWDAVDPGNTNWWETEIGESIAMGRISVFLGDVLSPEALAVSLKHNTGKLDPAGANGAWRTTNYLFEAVATHDFAKITSGFATLVQTVEVDDSGTVQEAVQPDASFWAHGAQLYSEGYGMALFTMVAMWADVSRGTSLAFTRDQLDTIAFYIIDGTRWMIREEFGMLYLLYRPAKTIDGVTSYAAEFLDPLDRMGRADALYARDYRELAANIRGATAGNGHTGDKYFWRSEFLAHQRDDYAIFTALNSSRTVGSEYRSTLRPSVGNEVVWAKAGVTAIQVTNEEYTALGPAFDWYHYPGSTVPYVKETTLGSAGRSSNGGSFTGGVTDGRYSVAVHSLDRASTQAQKSYFFFDDEMVALGSGIRSTSTAPIHTTINQVDAKANATVDGRSIAPGTAGEVVANPAWAYNDKVGYVFPDSSAVTVSNKTQTGSYYGEAPESHDAFTLYLDHGVAPSDAAYEYIVLPAASARATEAYAQNPAVTVLENDTSVQAVRHAGLKRTMATFYRAGSLDLGGGRILSVSRPAIVILDESGAQPVVSISNPSQPGLLVDVALGGTGEAMRGTFVLGSGANLGKTVTAPLVADDSAGSAYTASGSAAGHGPSLVGDGDQGTFWESAGQLPWVQKRLATGSFASGVELDWGTKPASRYLVQTSMDGSSWTDQKLVQNGTGGHESVRFAAVAANFLRVLLLDGSDSYTVRELAVTSSVNLALGAPTTASDGTGADSATDGNSTTRWIADRTGSPDRSWLQVDLGSVQHIGAVRLAWEASYAKQYKIQVSNDGSSWVDAYTTPAAGGGGGTELLPLDTSGRYVRMQTVSRALTSYGVSLWEFEVFDNGAIVDAPVVSGRANLALNRPTTADSYYNNRQDTAPGNATDGSTATKWSSNRPTGAAPYTNENWLRVDLGAPTAVSQAVIDWESSNATDYRVEGSLDGDTWSELAHVQNPGTANHRRDTVDFATAHVRYVRVIGSPATKYGLNIWELELYGGYSLACPTPVVATAGGTAVLTATINPAEPGDTFAAMSLDTRVVSVAGAGRSNGAGTVEFDLVALAAGRATVLVTHSGGAESASCAVTVAVDASALQQLVDQANGLDSTRYTPGSWAPLLPALEAAKATLRSAGATQAEIDARAAALRSAIEGLAVPADPRIQVSGAIVAGGRISVSGTGFEAGTAITVELHSTPVELGRTTVDQSGAFLLEATIPASTSPGRHEIVVLAGGAQLATLAVTVLAADGGDPGTGGTGGGTRPLASSGADPTVLWAGVGAASMLLVAGAVLLMVRRRRSQH